MDGRAATHDDRIFAALPGIMHSTRVDYNVQIEEIISTYTLKIRYEDNVYSFESLRSRWCAARLHSTLKSSARGPFGENETGNVHVIRYNVPALYFIGFNSRTFPLYVKLKFFLANVSYLYNMALRITPHKDKK